CLVATMIAGYAVLDGFDLGAGVVHLFVARSEAERRLVLASVGPVWDGNEVWLVAGGGLLFFAFPAVYASGFQGFYLPLIMVLWLLILRGIAIEFRDEVSSLVWQPFWDVVFAGASAMLAIFFGAAIGNLVRGVPLDRSGFFFLPLWANLRLMPAAGILDWFTIIVALGSLAALTVHGALWVAMKTAGAVAARARKAADTAWWAVLVITVLLVIIVPLVQPHLGHRFADAPWGFVFPLAAATGMFGVKLVNGAGRVSPLLPVHRRDAHQRGVRPLSVPVAVEHRYGRGAYGLQQRRRDLRPHRGPLLVHPRHGAGHSLFRVRVPPNGVSAKEKIPHPDAGGCQTRGCHALAERLSIQFTARL